MTDFTIASGDTETVLAGTQYWGDPVNVSGQLNLPGQLNVSPAEETSASGIGEGLGTGGVSPERDVGIATGTAEALGTGDATAERDILASGTSVTVGTADASAERALDHGALEVDSGTTATVNAGEEDFGDEIFLAEQLNLAGEVTIRPRNGFATASGTADVSDVVPLLREDEVTVDWNETDEITLDADGV